MSCPVFLLCCVLSKTIDFILQLQYLMQQPYTEVKQHILGMVLPPFPQICWIL